MKSSITIRFISGREEQFEVEFWSGGAGAQARLEAFLKSPTVVLQTSDEVIIAPGSAIECITIKTQKGDTWSSIKSIRQAKRIK